MPPVSNRLPENNPPPAHNNTIHPAREPVNILLILSSCCLCFASGQRTARNL